MLKMLAKDAKVGLAAAAVASASAKKTPKQPVAAKKRARVAVPSDGSDASDEEFPTSTSVAAASKRRKPAVRAAAAATKAQPVSDEDLFDSEEEEEISNVALARSKSRLQEYSDEESEGGYSDSSDRAPSGGRSGYSKSRATQDVDSDDGNYRELEEQQQKDESGPAVLEDYQRIQVRRVFVEKWLHEPYFESAVVHQFARIYIGQNPTNDTPIYRMCEIVGVGKRGAYKLSDSGIMTDRALIVAIGSSQQTKKLDAVSNSRISEVELKRYLEDVRLSCKKNGRDVRILTKNDATRRRAHATRVLSEHKYTESEIKTLIQERSGHNTFLTTDYSTAREKLFEKIEKAKTSMDDDTDSAALVVKLEREMEKMERNYNAHKEKLALETSKYVSLNQRNKGNNSAADILASVKRAEKDLLKDSDKEMTKSATDPFRRRETLPSIIWNTGSASKGAFTADAKSKPKSEVEQERAAAKAAADAERAAADAAAIAAGARSAASSIEYNLFVDTNLDAVSKGLGRVEYVVLFLMYDIVSVCRLHKEFPLGLVML